jgi:hypothetical protein
VYLVAEAKKEPTRASGCWTCGVPAIARTAGRRRGPRRVAVSKRRLAS